MRQLPRLQENMSLEDKFKAVYDWLYELQMELFKEKSENEIQNIE